MALVVEKSHFGSQAVEIVLSSLKDNSQVVGFIGFWLYQIIAIDKRRIVDIVTYKV